MSDYRNPNEPTFRNAGDPIRPDTSYEPNLRRTNAGWGWAAGAVFVVIVLAVVFGVGHAPNQAGHDRVANNAPPASQVAPAPAGPASPAYNPAPINPTNPAPLNPANPAPPAHP
jgi:hypothetical protein